METIAYTKKNCEGSLLEAAKKFNVEVEVADKDSKLMIFSKNNKKTFVKDNVPDLNSFVSSRIVCNKALTKRLLKQHGIPAPNGIKESSLQKALGFLKKGIIKFPLVIKPVEGSEGEAVTVAIENKQWFIRGIEEVYKYNRRQKGRPNSFLIEDYLPGDDFRFLVLDGRVLTVLMRKPAYVIGDGVKNINQLVEEYNSQPGVGKSMPLCPIVKDYEYERNLSLQELTNQSIISKDKLIYLRKNANVSTGGRSFECFDRVHPKYKELASRLSKLFKIRFCAVDIIAPDISKFEKFGVIEINDTPGFDIHEVPYRGKPFPVAEHLIKTMFK